MSVNDWNNLGRDVKNIVQNAIDTGDFGRLNRDLGRYTGKRSGKCGAEYEKCGKYGRAVLQKSKAAGRTKALWTGERIQYKLQLPSLWTLQKSGVFPAGEGSERGVCIICEYRHSKSYGHFADNPWDSADHYVRRNCSRISHCFDFVQTVAEKLGIILGVFGTAAVLSLIMAICGNQLRKKIKRFRAYVKTLNGKPYGSIRDLAKSVRKSEKFVRKDLKKMIQKRMFLEGHLDKQGTCLIASDEVYDQYMKTEENVKELKEKEAKSPKQQLSEEVKKVIEEGDRYIEEIRRSNDAIPGVEISNKIYHLENVILRIFQRVEQHPELIQDLHKFMDYYLPTTMKLLNAYEELDKQGLEGENIKTAKREIENTLDTINVAFENLLDSFYKETAWDVSADISVLKTMLAQEGLMEGKSFQRKE